MTWLSAFPQGFPGDIGPPGDNGPEGMKVSPLPPKVPWLKMPQDPRWLWSVESCQPDVEVLPLKPFLFSFPG